MKKNQKGAKPNYIKALTINGLKGRVLKMPTNKKYKKPRYDVLLIYGHHSSLERMYGIAEVFSKYANVVVPDLPGFGGMDSFYKIGEKPTLDNMADYLATFIKLNFKNKKINICGMSFGFIVATKMLQKYPELVSQVNLLVSLVGFTRYDEFKFKRRNFLFLRYGASFFSNSIPSVLFRTMFLNSAVITASYKLVADKHSKFKDADEAERNRRIKFEIGLWQNNDLRTYMDTTVTMLTLDLTHQKVNLPITHIVVDADQYFDNSRVQKNLARIFNKVSIIKANMPAHMPTVISDAKAVEGLIPKEAQKLLSKAAS